jgi:hypothetical protein
MDYNVLLNSFGLLLLTISSNYSDKLLSCDIQEQYTNSVWMKHVITYLLVLFFIVAIDKRAFEEASKKRWIVPHIFLVSFVVYLMFLIATKMQAKFVLIILSLIVVYMLLDIEQTGKDDKTIKRLEIAQIVVAGLIAVTALYGFVTYFLKQKVEYGDQFSYVTFLLGKSVCSRFQQEPKSA